MASALQAWSAQGEVFHAERTRHRLWAISFWHASVPLQWTPITMRRQKRSFAALRESFRPGV